VDVSDWEQNKHWFKTTVWPWIQAGIDLSDTFDLLPKNKDFQEAGFADFLTDFLSDVRPAGVPTSAPLNRASKCTRSQVQFCSAGPIPI
jgi:hypothetical protein